MNETPTELVMRLNNEFQQTLEAILSKPSELELDSGVGNQTKDGKMIYENG